MKGTSPDRTATCARQRSANRHASRTIHRFRRFHRLRSSGPRGGRRPPAGMASHDFRETSEGWCGLSKIMARRSCDSPGKARRPRLSRLQTRRLYCKLLAPKLISRPRRNPARFQVVQELRHLSIRQRIESLHLDQDAACANEVGFVRPSPAASHLCIGLADGLRLCREFRDAQTRWATQPDRRPRGIRSRAPSELPLRHR